VAQPSDSNDIAALSALYQAERSDGAAMQTANVAVVALAVAYAGATAVFLSGGTSQQTSPWVLAFLPLPLWVIAVFLAVLGCVQGRRALSGMIIERTLVAYSPLTEREINAVGLATTEKIYNALRGGTLVKLTFFITAGGAYIVSGAYSILMLFQAYNQLSAENSMQRIWIVVAPGAIYLSLAIVIALTVRTHERDRKVLATTALT